MSLDPDELAHLEEERDFLLASLADLEREHDAGDLDDADFEQLRDDYTVRAAEAIRAVEEQRAAFDSAREPRNTKRTVLVGVAVAAFAVVAGILVASSMGARKAGESASGGVTVKETSTQRAQTCITKMAGTKTQDPRPAIACFRAVLDDDPDNVIALTWFGWQSSLMAENYEEPQRSQLGKAASELLARAVKADPSYSYARAFRAVVAYRNGDAAKAREYLDDFRSHDPSADATAVIAQMDLEAQIALLEKAQEALTPTTTTTTPG